MRFFYFLAITSLLILTGAAAAQDVSEFDDFENDIQQDLRDTHVADPLESFNRGMFWVNDKLYFYALKPVARGYGKIVPKTARRCAADFFDNIQFPLRLVNNLLQLKWRGAGVETKRFVVNSTAGVLGLFDPAENKWNWYASDEDFGQTFAHYGVGPGFALYLPLFGPGNLRDAMGKIPAYFIDPVTYVDPWYARQGIKVFDTVNYTSLSIGRYEGMKKQSVDPYQFIQDAYQQNRLKKIRE